MSLLRKNTAEYEDQKPHVTFRRQHTREMFQSDCPFNVASNDNDRSLQLSKYCSIVGISSAVLAPVINLFAIGNTHKEFLFDRQFVLFLNATSLLALLIYQVTALQFKDTWALSVPLLIVSSLFLLGTALVNYGENKWFG